MTSSWNGKIGIKNNRRLRYDVIFSLVFLLLILLCDRAVAQDKGEKKEKTQQPTEFPSVQPSISASPTALPSAYPSAEPTQFISAFPSPTPTVRNTLKAQVYGALIPIMTFDILLSDEDAALPTTRNINAFFTMFMDQILAKNSNGFDFDYSHLTSNVLVSSFRNDHGRHRRLEFGYSVRVEGIAYFFEDAPTRESLLHSLRIYFTFWGITDLEEYLQRLGMESAKVVFIAIDEIPLDIFDDKDSEYDHAGAAIGTGSLGRTGKEGPSLQRKVAISGCVGAILITLLAVLLYGRRKRQQQAKKSHYWKRKVPSACETSESGVSPPETTTSLFQLEVHEDQSLSSGLISDDLSVYATNDDVADNRFVYGKDDNETADRIALVNEQQD
ncbi:hypothetical protein IV203_005428 [Nitzschia inconspicua]|uniref:Uncharacterized protein n=1 Tax=Nitzschia inconspicua TaxID=303405 RepID=A0A9K3PGH2_9STRA|nr:hypothetical protein IV203_005428 [Nitzschia inconspicua]